MSTTPVTPDTDQLSTPLQNPAAGPATAAPAAPAAAAPQPGSLWKGILVGALHGLAGAGGSTHFGGGLARGAEGELAYQQQQKENAQHQQQIDAQTQATQSNIKFQTAQAANAVAEAARNNATAAAMPQQARDAHDKAQLEMASDLQQLGITPTVIADDTHDAATAALQGLTDSHGGVPHLFNLEVGGQHLAYDLTQLSGTPQGLTIINNARQAQGQDPLTPAQWRQTPKPAQAQAAEGALKFFAPPPTTNAAQANGLFLQYKSFADAYAKKPDADPQVAQKLNSLVANLKDQKDGQVSQQKNIDSNKAYNSAFQQKTARNDVDQKSYQTQLASGDVTGWKPDPNKFMSEQQFNATNTKFVSGALAKAQDVEKGYQMFQEAYADRNDAKTGAQSMLALSQHLANTFGNVKGARITKDMIQEHLGARNVSDKATVAIQKITTGDVLSPDQWDAFHSLIGDARSQTWNNTVKQAHSLGLPVTADMLPAQKGK